MNEKKEFNLEFVAVFHKKKCNRFFGMFVFFLFSISNMFVFAMARPDKKFGAPLDVPTNNSKISIDGDLKEEAWKEALVLELDYEVEPGDNTKPTVKTEVLLINGKSHLYVAFRSFDPDPSKIRSHVTDRDKIWDDDYVGIIIDTFNDSRRTYNFYCNPLGIQADKIIYIIGGESEWDVIWNSAGRIYDDKYIVEMSIPLSSLKFQHKKGGQVWRIDAIRSYPRNLSHLFGIFPRDRNNNCYMCQAVKIAGFVGAKPSKNMEFDPTLTSTLVQERASLSGGEFYKKLGKSELGLSAKWDITPNFSFNGTINPDFSHIEADAAKLDINTQYALYFPEKRPFFMEGSSFFKSRLNAIYTRAILAPDWGIKVVGKGGGNSFGAFLVKDSLTNFIFPGKQGSRTGSISMSNISSVTRYSKDIGKSSSLGFLITNRQGENYFSHLAALDGNIKFSKKDRMVFQFLGSITRYPDKVSREFDQPHEKLTGSAIDIGLLHETEHIETYLHYQAISPGFRAELGLIRQAGYRYIGGTAGYIWRKNPGHWYTKLNFGVDFDLERDSDNNLLEKGVNFFFKYYGKLQSYFNLNWHMGKRTYSGIEFDNNYYSFSTSIRPSGSFHFDINGFFGDQISYSNVLQGKRFTVNPGVSCRLGRHLYVELDYIFETLKVDSKEIYKANLTNFALVFQFNRRMFLRSILQFADYEYNTLFYGKSREPEFRHLFSQFLFSYKLNPRTVFFFGYSDNYYGYQDVPVRQKNRALFLKIGYALTL
jgi:hypothetical protein